MTLRRRIYARSVIERLKAEIVAAPDDIIVMSPYLTSRTAEQVIYLARRARIYTTFEAETFASGGSSLATVRQLLEAGHRLFHIDRLHAKIVITDRIACLGSQNLTRGGNLNLEASIILDDPTDVAHLRCQLALWIDQARPITPEMIAHLDEQLPELRKGLLKLRREAAAVDDAVWTAQAERGEEVRGKAQEERRRQLREARIQRSLRANRERIGREAQAPEVHASESIHAYIADRSRGGDPHFDWDTYTTLKCAEPGATFREWWMSYGRPRELTRTNRYLVLNTETTALAWTAMFDTQLSKFASGVELDTPLAFREDHFALNVELAREPQELAEWNVRFDLVPWNWPIQRRPRTPASSIYCLFLGLHLELVRATYADEALEDFFGRDRVTTMALMRGLRAKLLSPFKYERNRQGQSPIGFLNADTGDRFLLRLREVEDPEASGLTYLSAMREPSL